MDSRKFQAEVALKGGRGFVALPFDPDDAWGAKERHHVSGLVDGCKVRGPLGELADPGDRPRAGMASRQPVE